MLRRTGPGKIEERESTSPTTRALLYNFDFDGDALKTEHANWLETYVVPLLYMPQYRVWMRGTASKVGDNRYNWELSKRRVKSVERHLLGLGVDPSQIQAEWAGEELSKSQLADDERDRAVEIHLQAEAVVPPEPVPPPAPPPAPPLSKSFQVRLLGSAQVGKVIDLGKAMARISKLAKLRKLPKVGFALDVMFLEIRDSSNHISGFYVYVAPGLGAGAYWVSATHRGPWNGFHTSQPILVSQFDGPARFTTIGVGPFSKNYLNLIGTPRGVDGVYLEDFETGFTWGAGASTTVGDAIFLDSAKASP